MSYQENLQPELRQRANDILSRLSPSEREALIIKCWMSHDARWFMAAAREFGMEATNRINQAAISETGEFEARRLIRSLKLLPVKTADDCLLAQEIIIGLFGPDLIDYEIIKVEDNVYKVHVKRCFACDNVALAGIADEFECGIFARSSGWFTALGVECEMTPPLGKCMKLQGQECIYTFRLKM
jgi:hypothetical protein